MRGNDGLHILISLLYGWTSFGAQILEVSVRLLMPGTEVGNSRLHIAYAKFVISGLCATISKSVSDRPEHVAVQIDNKFLPEIFFGFCLSFLSSFSPTSFCLQYSLCRARPTSPVLAMAKNVTSDQRKLGNAFSSMYQNRQQRSYLYRHCANAVRCTARHELFSRQMHFFCIERGQQSYNSQPHHKGYRRRPSPQCCIAAHRKIHQERNQLTRFEVQTCKQHAY